MTNVGEMKRKNCSACQISMTLRSEDDDSHEWFCADCMSWYPMTLLYAASTYREGGYAMGLRTGIEVRFSSAEMGRNSQYVRIEVTKSYGRSVVTTRWTNLPISAGDVDVRVSDIVWCSESGR